MKNKLKGGYRKVCLENNIELYDIDGCEGSIFKGCGTREVGGLAAREAIEVAYRVGKSEKFIGADIVELSPKDDCNGVTSQLVIKLVDVLWGYIIIYV